MKKRWFLCGTGVLFTADQILKILYRTESGQKRRKRAGRVHRAAAGLQYRHVPEPSLRQPEDRESFSLAAAGFVSLLYTLALFRKKSTWKKAALSMMTAGAWSNTFDRFARGHVTDYIGF